MTGAWQDYLKRVIKMDESEIALMQRIAQMVPSHHCRCIIQMMIQREKEEMEMLCMLMGMDGREPCKEPKKPGSPVHRNTETTVILEEIPVMAPEGSLL
ncbi:hypothetical protein [Syntrophaceticus schinkii]|uniref:Uncharacterized protein n=1 Tax=Syntrophaceticus schinkii TaxID=499207 RepID=A0A0B7MET4_9FIRM|nr:hypothetical protein [Syntrophaceticus schinkii]CEO88590.1 hypothetical protein SSCH_2170003 [Syntrophaceticus schinkii]